ncbi:hypothetical protein QP631_12490, partial [Staphylococcus lugdunensis]|nr:hypothetical protein [Staphylococcus lugdunensis]
VKSIAFVHLNAQDVVRAELVGRIVEAYEAWENREADFRREKARNRKSLESQAANESQNLERNIK